MGSGRRVGTIRNVIHQNNDVARGIPLIENVDDDMTLLIDR